MTQVRTIRDIIERFRVNWQGYLRRYWIFLVLIILAAAADMFSTIRFMLLEGPERRRSSGGSTAREYLWPCLRFCHREDMPICRYYFSDGLSASLGCLYLRNRYYPLYMGGVV